MKKSTLLCATTNAQKFSIGQAAFSNRGITLEQLVIDIDEIQGEDADTILHDKARKAFAAIGKPLLVTDDSWSVPALNGFPGPYMKSINQWFTPEDFMAIMRDKTDRTIYLEQHVAYIDADEIVTFNKRIKGVFVTEPRGHTGPPIMRVVELEGDGATIAELQDKGIVQGHSLQDDAWTNAADWYASR